MQNVWLSITVKEFLQGIAWIGVKKPVLGQYENIQKHSLNTLYLLGSDWKSLFQSNRSPSKIQLN